MLFTSRNPKPRVPIHIQNQARKRRSRRKTLVMDRRKEIKQAVMSYLLGIGVIGKFDDGRGGREEGDAGVYHESTEFGGEFLD